MVKAGDKPQIVMELCSREALREAVVKGIGIDTVSEAGYWPEPRLCMLRLSDTDIRTDTHVVCLKARRLNRAVGAFLEIAQELAHAHH